MPDRNADIGAQGVVNLAGRLVGGQLTSEQATGWYLAQIEQRNAQLNAFLTVSADQAIAQAKQADKRRASGKALSLIDGIPIALKDNIDIAGERTTNGVGALRDQCAQQTAYVAQTLLEAGAVILGKLNMDEAAMGATTNNPHFGACQNPFMPGDTPGGSSGGSGAAVAAGLCAAALGTDTLGSVRIPAAYCGTVGLIGSRGMVSRRGVCALSPTLDQVGVLARSVVDAAAVYTHIARADSYDEQSHPGADELARRIAQGLPPLIQASDLIWHANQRHSERIAVIEHAAQCDGPNANEVGDAVGQIAGLLDSQGYSVTGPLMSPTDYTALRRAALLVIEAEGFVACQPWLGLQDVSQSLKKMLTYGARQTGQVIEESRAQLRAARHQWLALFTDADYLLLPTAPQTSFALDAAVPAGQADFTSPASIAGLPAISLPIGQAGDGRALSVQLIGRPQSDLGILRLAARIEQALISR